ncbi:MAG TPA: PaaI family thioesterase [Acidimicrobiia bacterium]|nr:PaaI family thioesterase [Acidimicrobiia bacterium]
MQQTFTPADPDFDRRVRESFDRQAMMKTLGVAIASLEPGRIELVFSHRPEITQQHGFVHAGAVAGVLDSACGYAAFSLMPPEAAVLTVEFKVNLMRPADGERYHVDGEVLRAGRTLTVCHASARIEGESENLAIMTATLMTVKGAGIVD